MFLNSFHLHVPDIHKKCEICFNGEARSWNCRFSAENVRRPYDIPLAFVFNPSFHGISVHCRKCIINIVWVRVALAFFRALSYNQSLEFSWAFVQTVRLFSFRKLFPVYRLYVMFPNQNYTFHVVWLPVMFVLFSGTSCGYWLNFVDVRVVIRFPTVTTNCYCVYFCLGSWCPRFYSCAFMIIAVECHWRSCGHRARFMPVNGDLVALVRYVRTLTLYYLNQG